MRVAWLLRFVLLIGAAHVPLPVLAQCAGFTDVAPGSFCGYVTWMKNRQVTLGCAPGLYCPTDPVSRLAMAAFINRVGNVLTPTVLQMDGGNTSLAISLIPQFVCQTTVLPAVE